MTNRQKIENSYDCEGPAETTDEAIQELLDLADAHWYPLVDDPSFVEYLKNPANHNEIEQTLLAIRAVFAQPNEV